MRRSSFFLIAFSIAIWHCWIDLSTLTVLTFAKSESVKTPRQLLSLLICHDLALNKGKAGGCELSKKGIKKSSVMSLFTPAQKNRSCKKERHTLLYKGGGEVHLYDLERAEINFKKILKKRKTVILELNYKLKHIDTTKNIKGSLLQIRQLGDGCVRHDAFFERVAFFVLYFS